MAIRKGDAFTVTVPDFIEFAVCGVEALSVIKTFAAMVLPAREAGIEYVKLFDVDAMPV